MNDKQILKLKDIVENGGIPVYWMDNDNAPRQITRIGIDNIQEHGVEEPSMIAHIEGGGYIALWNCEVKDFVTIERIKF